MHPSEALALHRRQICERALRHGVIGVIGMCVFGLALHGDDTTDSDLDLRMDTLPATQLFKWGGLRDELQEFLGFSADVFTAQDLPARFRNMAC